MQILYGMPRFGTISETFVGDLLSGLLDRGHRVTVACNRKRGPDSNRERLQVIDLGYTRRGIVARLRDSVGDADGAHRRKQERAARKLRARLARERFDAAYIDFGQSAAVLTPYLSRARIPFVVHFHGADITRGLSDKAYRRSLGTVFAEASGIVAASNHIRRLLVLEGAPVDKIKIVRLGYDLEGTKPLAWESRRQNLPGIAFLGRLEPKKHPVALVEAFNIVVKAVGNARLTLIGDGSEMPRVRERIDSLDLRDRVTLSGRLPRSEALNIVNNNWAYAQHSVTARDGDQEGFGVSIAEAAALGLPVVSTLHNGIPEQVVHGETGYLVREHDFEKMAEHLIELLTNPDLSERMGLAGQQNIDQICSTDRRIDAIESIFSEIASTDRP